MSKISTKYKINIESEFEPGTNKKILRNKLGIKNKFELHRAEFESYIDAENLLIRKFEKDHRFVADDINYINRVFLGKIYYWAGKLRDINISKGGFDFASAYALPTLMKEFETEILAIPLRVRETWKI